MAAELTTQITAWPADNGYDLNADLVRGVAVAYTANAGFPGQFAAGQPHRAPLDVHRFDSARDGSDGRWLIDLAPMLNDTSFKQTLGNLNLEVPQTLTVPITVPEQRDCGPASCGSLATWGPWVSVGATILRASLRC